jgi:multiple sugar transport system substrate-binding protein
MDQNSPSKHAIPGRKAKARWGWPAPAVILVLIALASGCELPPPFGNTPTPSPSATAADTATPMPTPTQTVTPTQPATATPTISPTPSEVAEVTWFIGLGTGTDQSQIALERKVVSEFNDSQEFIHLNLEVVPFVSAVKKLKSEIDDDSGPDIVGPVGFSGSNDFHGQWLDLSPYISAADTEAYNPALLKMYHTDEGQVALPFALYPSAVYYNKKLFDAADLNYPPAKYGEKYEMPDGTQVDWDWEALAMVGRLLTLDADGNNATQDAFDSARINQYGFTWNFEAHSNYWGAYWGSGTLLAADGKTAQLPAPWKAAWEWTYNGIWGDQPLIGSHKVESSIRFGQGNPFNSGKVGMTVQPSWLTCCLGEVKTWDLAAMPAYQGQVGGRIDADTLLILKSSKHPYEAYVALSYLLNQGVERLIVGTKNRPPAYGAMSARGEYQQAWIDEHKKSFPWVTNWEIFIAGLDYPDVPHAEIYMPNFDKAWTRGQDFADLLANESDLDLAAEEQEYLDDLNAIFAK